METQPGAQERPKAFPGIDIDFTETVFVFITSIFTRAMTHGFVEVAPLTQGGVDGVLIGVGLSTRCNSCFAQGFNGGLLDIGKHPNHDLSTPLNHAGALALEQSDDSTGSILSNIGTKSLPARVDESGKNRFC